ncbi:hypothetical protein CDAR_518311 [Caerostris darwini]|uniref:Uncharacterized protein n=1 Tax=Caerostris darwini TaxID=1538125 RepID=A0AAV4RFZ1_9ARAC|nr:hypothetical protein CDAR_518311 [Caerostris darwini]
MRNYNFGENDKEEKKSEGSSSDKEEEGREEVSDEETNVCENRILDFDIVESQLKKQYDEVAEWSKAMYC